MGWKENLKKKFWNVGLIIGIQLVAMDSSIPIINMIDEYTDNNGTLMEQNLKKEKIQEYKKLFLEDKNLKLVFEKDELDELLDKNLKGIKINAKLEDQDIGRYNTFNKFIHISEKVKSDGFNEGLFHELTHVVSTRSKGNTGLKNSPKYSNILKLFFARGRSINEGLTQYITKKLVNKISYSPNKVYVSEMSIIKYLCMTYGEEFIFKAYKYGPEKLAEQIEKDGASYNELSELLDESENVHVDLEKQIETKKRALDITRKLFIKKYSQATLEEKFEIAKRTRDIVAEQTEKDIIALNPDINLAMRELEPNINDIEDVINIDLYKMYTSNHEIKGNINQRDVKAIQASINTVILGTRHIPLDDISQMRLEEVKNQKDEVVAYILRNKENIALTMYTFGGEGVVSLINGSRERLKLETIEILKNLEEKYKILEPIQANELYPETIFILNTSDGTKFFSYENDTKELTEFSVEDKFALGDVIVEKTKDKKNNTFKKATEKLSQALNIKQKNIKLLPEANYNNIDFSYNINDEFIDQKMQQVLNTFEEKFINKKIALQRALNALKENTQKRNGTFSTNIVHNEFREKYKADTTNLNNFERNNSKMQKNNRGPER